MTQSRRRIGSGFLGSEPQTVTIAGTPVHLVGIGEACEMIASVAHHGAPRPLAVSPITPRVLRRLGMAAQRPNATRPTAFDWLNVISDARIARRVEWATGSASPRVTASQLIAAVLDDAVVRGLSVGVVNGRDDGALRHGISARWPGLRFAGIWDPSGDVMTAPARGAWIAEAVRHAQVDMVFVGGGIADPEEWIEQFGIRTGAGALLALDIPEDLRRSRSMSSRRSRGLAA